MSHVCPLCAAPIVDDGRVLVDVEGGLIVGGGRVATLTAQEFELFTALWMARPRTLSKAALMDAVYGLQPGEEPEIKIVDVFVCKLRPKLKGMGVSVETVWGKGYRLITGREAARSLATAADHSHDNAIGEMAG